MHPHDRVWPRYVQYAPSPCHSIGSRDSLAFCSRVFRPACKEIASPICDPGLPFRATGDSDTYRVPVSNRPTGNLPDTSVIDSRGMQATRCSRELRYCDGLPGVR